MENSGNWDGEYRFYYSSHQLIETRNGNDDVLKQYVWGTQYIDELIQVSANPDPADAGEDECECFQWWPRPAWCVLSSAPGAHEVHDDQDDAGDDCA